MTEAKWLSTDDCRAMLRFLENRGGPRLVSDRKLRLFACAFGRILAKDPRSFYHLGRHEVSSVIAAVEAYADGAGGLPDNANYLSASDALSAASHAASFPKTAAILRDIAGNPFRPVRLSSFYLTPTVLSLANAAYQERERYCKTCRGSGQIKRRVDEPIRFRYADTDPHSVVARIEEIACTVCGGTGAHDGTLDPTRLAILSDALEEAGTTDQSLLRHLRDSAQHYCGCHFLDLILGKS